jgi:hypothetical protein
LRSELLHLVVLVPLLISSVAAGGQETGMPEWMKRVRLTGTVEGDYYRTDHGDMTGQDSGLSISTMELGVEADFSDFASGFVLFLAEDLGTGEEINILVDEATLALREESSPFYLIFGKRVQPFGVFENHLVADPMTQDAYETNRVGLTAGYAGPMGVDISATLYKGEEQMEHLFESGLFDPDALTRSEGEEGKVESYIVTALITPIDDLTVFGAFLSEPGRGQRNNTANVGLSIVPSFFEGLRIDVEYMKALDREIYDGLAREFKEGVFSLTAAYEFVFMEREVIGGAIFAERKAHLVSEPLELAVRYEHFDDDGIADDLGIWSVKDRYSAGGRYTFYENIGLTAYLAVQYRRTKYRLHPDLAGTTADDSNEYFARLGVTF